MAIGTARAATSDRRGPAGEGYRLYAGAPRQLLRRRAGDGPRLIVTPNLDHLRLLHRRRSLRRAYAAADVVLVDSRFLARAAFGDRALCYPGSEFAPDLLRNAPAGARVLVVGASPAVRRWLADAFGALIVEVVEPSQGFIRRRDERRAIVARTRAFDPALVLVCTGAPQSELLALQLKRALADRPCDIVCCGSALRFLAGEATRAPGWMRRGGVEWAWRFAVEPRTRRRYLLDAAFLVRALPGLLRLRRAREARLPRYTLAVGERPPR